MDKEVKVYSTRTWPWCAKVKQWLDEKGVKYQELNVGEDKAARDEMVNKTHQMVVPTILIDGEVVVGFNEKVLKEKLGIS